MTSFSVCIVLAFEDRNEVWREGKWNFKWSFYKPVGDPIFLKFYELQCGYYYMLSEHNINGMKRNMKHRWMSKEWKLHVDTVVSKYKWKWDKKGDV